VLAGIGVLVLACGLVVWGGCEPREENRGGASGPAPSMPTGQTPAVTEAHPQVDVAVRACELIARGRFDAARDILEAAPGPLTGPAAEAAALLAAYDRIEEQRQAFRQENLQEQLEELDKLRAEIGDGAVDVNDIGEVIGVVIKAREHADESQKAAILEDPFVQRVIATARETGDRLEAEGHWVDAYAQCYYWLAALDEDNPQYKARTEELIEKAAVEMALKDDSCGDTSLERHEGIRPVMFQRAVDALDFQYVTEPDFGAMVRKALARCRILSEVLQRSREALAFRSGDPEVHRRWQAGIETFEAEVGTAGEHVGKQKLLMIFDEVLRLNDATLGLPKEVVVAQFAEAALSALDPFTMLVWPWNVRDFEKNMKQEFYGIGVEISKATGVLKVASLLPDTPAYRSGLDAEDEILAVDGEPTDKMTIFCAVSKITGPKGTTVRLTVRHAATGEVEDITIRRDKIVVPPLRGWRREDDGDWQYMLDPEQRIGYVRVTTFTENTVPELDKALRRLEAQGMRGLILDLRFNSGGYLVSAADLVDLFVDEGVIVTSRPRPGRGWPDEKRARAGDTHPGYPLVVLINEQSASASEIVAGALQDPVFHRATLVGSRTYGKGSVQVVVQYTGGGSQLKMTIAYYHLPSGQRVKNRYVMEKLGRKDWGIEPDVPVELSLSELRRMIDTQRDNEVLVKADHDNTVDPVTRHSLAETLESDPQLATAVLVARAKVLRAEVGAGAAVAGVGGR